MRQPYTSIIIAVILATVIQTSCKPTSNSENMEKGLTQKNQAIHKNKVVIDEEKQLANNTISNELSFLKAFDKKYPYEINLFDKPVIKKRLKEMLGPEYAFIKNNWEVETPITIGNGMFFAWGMKAHSGGDPGAVLMADLDKNVLYVGIRKNKNEKFYSEDGSNVPQKMQDWADEQ